MKVRSKAGGAVVPAGTTFGNPVSIDRPAHDSDVVSLRIPDHTVDEGVTTQAGALDGQTAFTFNVAKSVATVEAGSVSTDSAVWANPIEVLALHVLRADGCRCFSVIGFKHREVMEPEPSYS